MLWSELTRDPNAFHLDTLFGIEKVLFRQASQAFDAGAHAGASLLCRSVLEAALYVALTRTKGEQPRGAWNVAIPIGLDGRTRMVPAREMVRAMRKSWILKNDQKDNLKRVFEHGNVIAHTASKKDTEMWPLSKRRRRLRLWVTEAQALQDLRDTVDILKRLAFVAAEIPEWFARSLERKSRW